jgi:hypothetical protein
MGDSGMMVAMTGAPKAKSRAWGALSVTERERTGANE